MSDNFPYIGAVNVTSTEVKCPGCGGTIGIKYDPETLNLTCPFCGLVSQLPKPGAGPAMQELDFNSALQRASVNWGHVKKLIICSNCGGEALYNAEQVTGACPFCGSTSVTPAAENAQIMAPQGVIPFAVSAEMAQQCFTNFLNGKSLAPKKVLDCRLENLVGIYLPFWTFDALTVSSFTGHGWTGSETTRVNYAGVWNQYFDDLIIYASDKIYHPHIKRLQNFDFRGMVPYSPEYLAGIPAERYTVGLNDGWERTKSQIRQKLERAITRKTWRQFCLENVYTNYYNVKFRYVLAPMYLAYYRYGKRKFPVAVNGQTGQTFCEVPTYLGRVVLACILGFLTLLACFFFAFIFPSLNFG